MCIEQSGSRVEGLFEFEGECTIRPRDSGDPIELALDDCGTLAGTVNESEFHYETVGDSNDESCQNSGTLPGDRPLNLGGSVVCMTPFNEDELLRTEGSGTARLID